ncbi:MAG: metal-dependent transcriptional regulator, partial [Puniceicoccaceae bacterium]
MERIDELLGRPTLDPHGDPIPDAEGRMGRRDLVPLVSAEGKGWVEVARVKDQTEVFLRFVDRNGLKPGRR